jgi:DNA-binding NtrC family response regulator
MDSTLLENRRVLDRLIAASRAMRDALAAARQAASSADPVFVDGQTGTGRKLLARIVHGEGPRASRPFVTVRCDTLTVDVLDRVLCGDPRSAEAGVLEQAADGTLLLADLEELNPVAQERLAWILAKGSFPDGLYRSVPIRCRIVCTGKASEIRKRVKLGYFSEELWKRLSAETLHMPSLAERRDDIPLLVAEILRELGELECFDPPAVPYHYMELLTNVAWPENVRQLRNHVESVMVLSEGNFDPEIIREHFVPEGEPETIKGAVQTLFKKLRSALLNPAYSAQRR